MMKLVQNWSHVSSVIKQLNCIPSKQHGTDIMRIRPWYISNSFLVVSHILSVLIGFSFFLFLWGLFFTRGVVELICSLTPYKNFQYKFRNRNFKWCFWLLIGLFDWFNFLFLIVCTERKEVILFCITS